ncbi:hypothetical protein L9F63_012344 [Diploptera punctata]|uniref:Uncharacterized protein n=1 Tax=Diploptera punctata TaxID=6984 RepID=A0AAD8ACU2_DIPPU|nr:hypothetical protein L9F63_012344 [Diploptera punctata]
MLGLGGAVNKSVRSNSKFFESVLLHLERSTMERVINIIRQPKLLLCLVFLVRSIAGIVVHSGWLDLISVAKALNLDVITKVPTMLTGAPLIIFWVRAIFSAFLLIGTIYNKRMLVLSYFPVEILIIGFQFSCISIFILASSFDTNTLSILRGYNVTSVDVLGLIVTIEAFFDISLTDNTLRISMKEMAELRRANE